MKAEERKHLEENTLAHGVTTLVDRVKSGRLVNLRWLGLILAVVLVIGIWLYASFKSKQADSAVWSGLADLFRSGRTTGLVDFATSHKETVAGRLARVETARNQLGPEGIALLQLRDKDERAKGVKNIQQARDEFGKLADEFADDPTMKATCLLSASEAELALVGIPKGDRPGGLGTVDAAADLCRRAAQAIGENTPVGEQANKRAEELLSRKDEIERVGDRLNVLVAPPTATTAPPGVPHPDAPKPPEGPIQPPKPPSVTPEGPKAPDKPLTTSPDATGGVVGGAAGATAPQPPPPMPDPNKK